MKNILLGVTGGIAAYKAAEISRLFVKRGISVQVIMTSNAQRFIAPLTFQTLTKQKVYTGMFENIFYEDVRHISLAKGSDLAVIAPATANIIGKLAGGIADDMLTTVIMAMSGERPPKPVIVCPAMNTSMWENPIVQRNVEKLKTHGFFFVGPAEGVLACGDSGSGALAGVDEIVASALSLIERSAAGNDC
ncbi:MAG: phosphopantothenoylcysteine decarboxylase [Spirochaetaceae bacterium]|jgi:phosphopantothenoylcysteine decarboxylase/phosphopantothenoylcysteine decarboxylase/phosphopantothenate--cysteine ligase|nr:phosphopantothenoylcysteine decarboxylase [Spirochaetaceae bacterium]